MTTGIVGRDLELHEVDRFLRRAAGGCAAIVLEGPAGIGKSLLLGAFVEDARRRDFTVLVARPTGAESSFAYQSLADLFADVLPEARRALPGPQRAALDAALLQVERGDASVDPQLVAVGATSAILGLSRAAPVLVAVDDAPWLDAATAAVLTFAARRFDGHPIGVVVTQRTEHLVPVPLELDRALQADRRWLDPLSIGALHALLAERLGLTLPRPTLSRLHNLSQGNPLHALEIGRSLQRQSRLPRPGEPLPVPETLRALLRERVDALPGAARDVLLVVATAGRASGEELVAVLGATTVRAGLAQAVDAGVLVIDDHVVRFSHPLLASTVSEDAGPARRRKVHVKLATVASTGEARARHLALAHPVPDAGVADALDEAAGEARRRGAMETAAELYRLALEHTPADQARQRDERCVRLANALFELPDMSAVLELLVPAIPNLPAGPLRAEARMIAGTAAWYVDSTAAAGGYLRAAVDDSADDIELLGRIRYRLALFEETDDATVENAAIAVDLLRRTSARTTLAAAIFMLFFAEVTLGRPPRLDLLDEGLALEDGVNVDQSTIPGIWWVSVERLDLALERYRAMLDGARASGDRSGEPDLLTRIAEAEVVADDWASARRHCDDATRMAGQDGQAVADPALRIRALIDAFEGRLDDAEVVARAGLERSEAGGERQLAVAYLGVLLLVASTRGDHAEVERLGVRCQDHLDVIGRREPLRLDPAPYRVEALIALGRLAEAERLLTDLQARNRTIPRHWLDSVLARGQALLLQANGQAEAAVAATDIAVRDGDRWRPFDLARTLLVRGQLLRSLRRPRDAAVALDEARAIFVRVGARAWSARAAAEIGRLGRRRPGDGDLTPAEQSVAELAASGLRNREVAERLGLSPKTVEAHLARTYEKLGIRSRAELGALMRDAEKSPM